MTMFANFVRGRDAALSALKAAQEVAEDKGSDYPSTIYYLNRADVLAQLALAEAIVGLARALSQRAPSDGNPEPRQRDIGPDTNADRVGDR